MFLASLTVGIAAGALASLMSLIVGAPWWGAVLAYSIGGGAATFAVMIAAVAHQNLRASQAMPDDVRAVET
ncbi:hypothetical protein [Cypionkella sp.]|uniref:hypothetical protein n=1 Tax=Cypionkella sp. TaxID=2811411 RepID=UPI002AC956D5|nr:hypothetical protein [Cypionkella sp.]